MPARLLIAGIALAATFIAAAHWLGGANQLQVFALFLALTAAVYGGAALTPSGIAFGRIEFPFVVTVFLAAVAGATVSPLWLAGGYFAHGAWDVLHHTRAIRTPVVTAFPPICAAFDVAVGGFVLGWWLLAG